MPRPFKIYERRLFPRTTRSAATCFLAHRKRSQPVRRWTRKPSATRKCPRKSRTRRNVDDAAKLLDESPFYPTLHYATLCHRAAVLRACARWEPSRDDEALHCLKEAVTLLEIPRLNLSETDVARAEFFFQYTPAFDQLIEWYRQRDQPLEALVYADLCRSRTLLDWICSNGGVDQAKITEQLQNTRGR